MTDLQEGQGCIPVMAVAELAVDVWRIRRRASQVEGTAQGILNACQRAMDTLTDMGIEVRELVGEPYDENLRVHVVHLEDGEESPVVSQCLSPAIYYSGQLVRRAEVVLKGEVRSEQSDS